MFSIEDYRMHKLNLNNVKQLIWEKNRIAFVIRICETKLNGQSVTYSCNVGDDKWCKIT